MARAQITGETVITMNRETPTPNTPRAASRKAWLLLGVLLLACLVASPAALADVAFYHSPNDNGLAGTSPVAIGAGSPTDLHLYLDGGSQASSSGEACSDGDGEELCGWNVLVLVPSGMTLLSFTPDPSGDIVYALEDQQLRANGLDVFSPTAGPVRLGTLQVQASSAGDVLLKSGTAAGAALQIRTISRRTVTLAVPEPGAVMMGLAVLIVVGILRRRRGYRSAAIGCALLGLVAAPMAPGNAAEVVLNEYNGVAPEQYINGGDGKMDSDGNAGELIAVDSYFGRVAGNGGDWIELVTVAEDLDLRGYQLEMLNDGSPAGLLTFSDDPLWNSLAPGTLITIAEELADDVSYDPEGGDFWIHVQAHAAGTGTYITASDFETSNQDWLLEIFDADGRSVFGPVGEGLPDRAYPNGDAPSVNPREAFRLEENPSATTHPGVSYDDADDSTFGSENTWGDVAQNLTALRAGTDLPDRDGDGVPDDGDFSGVVGDTPCTGPEDTNCDDNCPMEPNPSQADSGGPDGSIPDGIGDACQCGDVSDDGEVAQADLDEIRQNLADPAATISAARKCVGALDGRCDIVAAARLKRMLEDSSFQEDAGPTCSAGQQPADPTAYYFNPSRLLDITVILEPESWEILRREGWGGTACSVPNIITEITCRFSSLFAAFLDPPPLPSPYNWYNADVKIDGQVLLNVGARKKGFIGSAFGIRPSLKLDFPEFVSGQRLDGLRRMTLNNNNQDGTRIKTCTNYRFLRDIGLPAPRCSLAEVQVNTEELGFYSNIDPIDDKLLVRYFGRSDGKLYEGQAADFAPGRQDWFQAKSDAADADRSEIEALTAAIQIEDPEERLAAIEGIVNVPGFINLWAGEGIAGLWDGYVASANNYLFYVDPSSGLINFIPWGADHGLGDRDATHCTSGNDLRVITPRSALALALYESETFRERLVEHIEYVAENIWDAERYASEMDRLYAIVGGSTNFLGGTKNWIRGRLATVREEIADGPPDISDVPPSCNFLGN